MSSLIQVKKTWSRHSAAPKKIWFISEAPGCERRSPNVSYTDVCGDLEENILISIKIALI